MPPSDPEAQPAKTLRGKWRLDAELGQGGMATVFAATHRNGLRGAIKLLHVQYCKDEKIRSRLLREGYLANRIQHPGIVKVLDDDVTEDGRVFLVMELLTGQTLKARWSEAGGRLPPNEALDVCDAVLDVLTAAHAEGVVHRDVKPDNVFLTEGGVVKVLDFGIAGIKESTGEMTHTSEMLGTPAFMSPEQALAHWSDVDARSDLFAVGAMLFTLITGELVHRAKTVPELLVAAATKPARPLAQVIPEVAPILAGVVDKALSFERVDRWQTAEEMRAALRRARAALRPGTVRLDQADAPDALKAAIAGSIEAPTRRASHPDVDAQTQALDREVDDANATIELESPFGSPSPRRGPPIATAPTLAATLQSAPHAAPPETRIVTPPSDGTPAISPRPHATVPLLDPARAVAATSTRQWNGLDPTHHDATRSIGAPADTTPRARIVAFAWLGGVALAIVGLVSYRYLGPGRDVSPTVEGVGSAPTVETLAPTTSPAGPTTSATPIESVAIPAASSAATPPASAPPRDEKPTINRPVVPTPGRPVTARPPVTTPAPAFTDRPSEKPAPVR